MKKLFMLSLIFMLSACAGVQLQKPPDQDLSKRMEQSGAKWSDYGDMGAATIADVDTFLVRDVSDTTLAATGTQKEYPWSVMKTDLTTYFDTLYAGDPDNLTGDTVDDDLVDAAILADRDPDTLVGDNTDDDMVDNAIVAPPAAQSVTCTENGSPSTLTITPTAGLGRVDTRLTVDDAEGCTITMGEVGAVTGTLVTITNVSAANTATFTTSANVLTLKRGSPYVMGSNEEITLLYTGSLWLEIGRSGSELLTILDDAAQFANAADTSKKVKIDPSNQGAGQTGTIQAPVNGTATLQAGTQVAEGVATGGILLGDATPDAAGEIGFDATDKYLFYGANSEDLYLRVGSTGNNAIIGTNTGITDLSFSAINLVTTGTILGAVNVVVTTDGSESPTAAQMYGTMFIADHATATSDTTYTLPAAATGMAACFYDNGGGTGGITIEIDGSDIIILDGTALDAGDTIDSPGVAGDGANGDFICIMAIDATNWITLGRSGTWVDGGAT